MIPFRIVPLAAEVAARVREQRADAYGNRGLEPRVVEEAHSAPCRLCLEDAQVGERVLLFSYSPFAEPVPYRAIGPVFVHADGCAPRVDDGAIPAMLRRRLLAVRAYDAGFGMRACDLVPGAEIETLIERMLADPAVEELHVHNARAGCFNCRIVRRPAG